MSQPVVITPYRMAINNVANYIRSLDNRDRHGDCNIDAFQASEILAIAFCKLKEDVLADIVSAPYYRK